MPKKNAKRKQTITQSEAGDTNIRRYIENQDPVLKYIEEEFAEVQTVSKQEPGEGLKRERQQKEHVILSAGDLDAGQDTGSSGEKTVGGSNPIPDQDNIDELGEAAGLTFQDSEQIRGEKIFERDTDRWELNPASSEDYEERNRSR